MSISDEMMLKYYTLLTDEDLDAIKKMHPKEAKVKLAQELIGQYHSKKDAEKTRLEFERVFSQGELPQDIPEYKTDGKQSITTILLNSRLVKSGNEARRLIKQGAVSLDNSKVRQENFVPIKGGVLKVGSRRFLKIIV